ncbi:hypothetical protein [Lentzea sp. NPDC003310]|uniref:hypothetical protein n=1 Tax=Lentzea sp. NPDC003310 TaxID=3154447 RepID=UPI0033A34A1B
MTTALAAAVRAASGSVTGQESQRKVGRADTAVVRMFGRLVGLSYESDPVEVPRRLAFGSDTSVPSMALLDALMSLPLDQPVAVKDLTTRQRQLLRAAPLGAVEIDRLQVTRRAVAPLQVRFALLAAKDWASGLERAGQFAPHCERALLLRELPRDNSELLMQASFYGVGVFVLQGAELERVVEPSPYVRVRHTPAHWWFAEEAYAQIRASGAASSS